MSEIPNFWDIGPHNPLVVEKTWHKFVKSIGGQVVEEILPASPSFENADYIFTDLEVVAELKEVQTEFLATEYSRNGFEALLKRLSLEDPSWRPTLLGGYGKYPTWFQNKFIRLARPPISRIIKKANIQLRETKKYFNITAPKGILLFVNDGFTGLAPSIVNAIACNLLVHSYSSIDCFIYLNVNRYIEISGSNEPKLIWQPNYSVRANDDLVRFVDDLGQRWFDFLEQEIGQFTSRVETPSRAVVQNSRTIILPHENRG